MDTAFMFAYTNDQKETFRLLYKLSGAKQGLLIRGGDVLERLANVDCVAIDKVLLELINYMVPCFYC